MKDKKNFTNFNPLTPKKMTNLITVIETYMEDGNDLIHEWYSVKEALKSGRFDYLIENGSYKEKQLTSCKTIEELVELVGYPFYCK
jgi:hypothetical protein